jgi:hypothetical protein
MKMLPASIMEVNDMKISEINFDSIESARKKCITFAKDGNTVVRPYKTLYCVEKITHDKTHANLYIEVVKSKEPWEENSFYLWDDLDAVCISLGWISHYNSLEEFVNLIDKYEYKGVAGFYKRLEVLEQNNDYINKADIAVCSLLGNIDLAKHYFDYRENQIAVNAARRKAEMEERRQKEIKEEEKRLAQIEKTIADAEYRIYKQEDVENIEVEGKSIVNALMKKYEIKVPLRTQGWINSKLARIVFKEWGISYMYYGKSQKDNSKVFRKYLIELENAINEKMALPF